MSPLFWIGLSAFLIGFAAIIFCMLRLRALRTPYGPTHQFEELAPKYNKVMKVARVMFWAGFIVWTLSIKFT